MLDVLMDALIDTVKLLPFLFLTYLLMEWLEHRTSSRTKEIVRKSGRLGPLFGGILGAFPQCGFSTAAANLFAGRVISAGTLIAIFLSTSDEMLPILISEQAPAGLMLSIVGMKILVGMAAGFAIDWLMRKNKPVEKIEVGIGHICEHDHCHCDKSIFKSALKHTLVITAYIFAISLVLNVGIYFIGEDNIANVILYQPVIGPMLAGVVGLIPNCAASVVITQMYLEGLLSLGSMLAGLLAGSGIGLLVLFKVNSNHLKTNLKITGTVYVIGVAVGILVDLFL